MRSEVIRVSIIEDKAEERALYASIVDGPEDMSCVSQHPNAAHALRHLPNVNPGAVLVDIGLPHCSGIECVRQLKTLLPSVLPIMLTRHEDDDHIFASLQAGAAGYLVKVRVNSESSGSFSRTTPARSGSGRTPRCSGSAMRGKSNGCPAERRPRATV